MSDRCQESMDGETPANRLKRAREALGLGQHAVAKLIGIGVPWYFDLEAYENELSATLSLATLCHLAQVVRTDPLVLLIGERANSVERTIQFSDLVQGLTERMKAAGLDVEGFGDRVGWDLTKILRDPQELWEFKTEWFVDVARAVGVEWTSAFPRTGRPAT